ncbi:helix-turn-helix transcriptional regulator [Candidatus Protochlamydia phocaeensis]|uniref:helix-turn-helix transcriptional regulator n=1 Tax=Candidatus Protochlamydia phocaeensis TaxID=1414722 RepID=UPI0008381E19|nr:PAS domain-containing protein [Candidatus Protochlamydia phocaeensis]
MSEELNVYFPIAEAIAQLLHPWAEVVIHDLKTRTIAALFNNFSKRAIGEDSLLEEEIQMALLPAVFETYYKTNWDGRKLKSTTAVLRSSGGQAIGLLCINLDISKMEECQKLIQLFIAPTAVTLPKELFSEDWKEKISVFVHDFLQVRHLTLQSLSKEQKKELVRLLHQEGAFRAKNAAHYVGSVLGISRATVYKYLGELSSTEVHQS